MWKITINDAKSADNPYLVYSFLPKGSTMLTDGIFCWLESSDTVLKRYLFFFFLRRNKFFLLFVVHFLNNRVYLCPQWGLYSFFVFCFHLVCACVCVCSRASTVTYLIFVIVTEVYTYSIDVYIVSNPEAMWQEGLCAAHDCLWIVFLFFVVFLGGGVCLFFFFFCSCFVCFLHWILKLYAWCKEKKCVIQFKSV